MADNIDMENIAEQLIEIAKADYPENDPTTGEVYEYNGRVIVWAAAEIERLKKDVEMAWALLGQDRIIAHRLVGLLGTSHDLAKLLEQDNA